MSKKPPHPYLGDFPTIQATVLALHDAAAGNPKPKGDTSNHCPIYTKVAAEDDPDLDILNMDERSPVEVWRGRPPMKKHARENWRAYLGKRGVKEPFYTPCPIATIPFTRDPEDDYGNWGNQEWDVPFCIYHKIQRLQTDHPLRWIDPDDREHDLHKYAWGPISIMNEVCDMLQQAVETAESFLVKCEGASRWTKATAAAHHKNCRRVAGWHETKVIFEQGQVAYWAALESENLIFCGNSINMQAFRELYPRLVVEEMA